MASDRLGPVTIDPRATAQMLVWRGLDLVAPRFPELTAEEKRAIRERDLDALTPRLIEILERDLWEQGVDPEYLSSRSFGFQVQHKSRDRILKLLRPETLRVQVEGEVKALPDVQLLELVGALGIFAAGRQEADSTVEVPVSASIVEAQSLAETPRELLAATDGADREASLHSGGESGGPTPTRPVGRASSLTSAKKSRNAPRQSRGRA